ncbi:MAG: CPBP family intramembrane metalloprotease [Prevotellaceae bacterium]|nr:CPBP family intramembrane metalloprotease [Prevotellaceae bacterium]
MLKALLAFLLYGVMQIVCGLIVALPSLLKGGGKPSLSVSLALSLLLSGVLTVLIVWRPLRMIRLPGAFSVPSAGWGTLLTGLLGGVACVVATDLMGEMTSLPDNTMEALLGIAATPLGALAISLVGPVSEELVFREGIQGCLHRSGIHPMLAILVSALLFGILHLNPAQSFFAALVGISLGILYYRTGSVWLCGLLHIMNNTLAVLEMRVLGQDALTFRLTDWVGGKAVAVVVMLLCLLLSAGLLLLFWRKTGKSGG